MRELISLEIELYREAMALSNICDVHKRQVAIIQVAENLQKISAKLEVHAYRSIQSSQKMTSSIDNP